MDKVKLFTNQKNVIPKCIIDNDFDLINTSYDTLKHNTRLHYTNTNKVTSLSIDKYGILVKTNPTTYMKGNNIEQLTSSELSIFVEQFEDQLHINTNNFQLTGFDYNINITTDYAPVSYLQAFRTLPRYTQSIYPYGTGVSYHNGCKSFNIYDKVKQLDKLNVTIPPDYMNINLLRLELQVKQKMKQTKELNNINTINDLCNPLHYLSVINQFDKTYNSIHKQPLTRYSNMTTPNPSIITTTDFALLYYINEIGMDNYINLLEQEKNMGLLTYRKYKTRKDKAFELWETYSAINPNQTIDLLNEIQTKYRDRITNNKQMILSHA